MNARRTKPSARGTAAKKPAVSRKHGANVATRRAVVAKKRSAAALPTRAAAGGAKPSSVAAKRAATALGADCTIEHSHGLHKQLAKILPDRACVTLDFAAVKRCDTAGLQLLAAFIRERREGGRAVELTGLSDNFLATAKLLGLSLLFAPALDSEGRA